MKEGFSLEALGVYGFRELEDAVLACLALGDPLLLIGRQGASKTYLAEALAASLGLEFWAYDASKAMFEDVVGFPDPRAMHDGRVGYLQTPLTIWGKQFVLVDELSRATAGMQNKWLEVIRSRRVMGAGLPDLKYVVAAMNPPGMLGTSPLDEALAGRFTFLLDVPEVHRMSDEDRRKVICNRTAGDSTAMGPIADRCQPALGPLLDRIRRAMRAAEEAVGDAATTYVDRVAQYMAAKEVLLDGRRVGMMRRALVALVAVHVATGRMPKPFRTPPLDLFRHGLDVTLPFRACGRSVSALVIEGAHAQAVAALQGRTRRSMPYSNLLVAARSLLKDPAALRDRDDVSLLVTRIVATAEHPTKIETALQAGAALCLMAGRPDLLAALKPEARQRLMTCWRELATVKADESAEFGDKVPLLQHESALSEDALSGVLRVAFRLSQKLDARPAVSCSFEEFAPKLLATVEEEVIA